MNNKCYTCLTDSKHGPKKRADISLGQQKKGKTKWTLLFYIKYVPY